MRGGTTAGNGNTMSSLTFLRDYCCCAFMCPCLKPISQWGEGEAQDDDAVGLSHVGQAAYDCLRKKYWWFHHHLWNVTSGEYVALDHTPHQSLRKQDLEPGHSDWLPKKIADLVALTEIWCDVTSLSPPDGLFLVEMNRALVELHNKNKPITVRMLFGNVLGMPVNCNSVIAQLTKGIPTTGERATKLRLWVGAWRKGVSWNHSKLVAVDGNVLHTGGHNMWDAHYLRHDPVHDLSLEVRGRVAHDGHLYANDQWAYIEVMQRTWIGYVIDKLPDGIIMPLKSRVTVSEFPVGVAGIYPPKYRKALVPRVLMGRNIKQARMISMGRYGKITSFGFRPSYSAIVAMLTSAKTIIRLALQDLGPVCVPGSRIALPGCTWPHIYLRALGKVIWERGVDVEIVLSNPQSIPGGLKLTEACYGNGTCD